MGYWVQYYADFTLHCLISKEKWFLIFDSLTVPPSCHRSTYQLLAVIILVAACTNLDTLVHAFHFGAEDGMV